MTAYATALKESSKEALLEEALRLHDQLAAAEERAKRHEKAYQDEYKRHSELLGILGEFFPGGADVREALERQAAQLAAAEERNAANVGNGMALSDAHATIERMERDYDAEVASLRAEVERLQQLAEIRLVELHREGLAHEELTAEVKQLRQENELATKALRDSPQGWALLAQAEHRAEKAEQLLASWQEAADEDVDALKEAGVNMNGHSIVYGIRKLASKLRAIENWATENSAQGLNLMAVRQVRAILDRKE